MSFDFTFKKKHTLCDVYKATSIITLTVFEVHCLFGHYLDLCSHLMKACHFMYTDVFKKKKKQASQVYTVQHETTAHQCKVMRNDHRTSGRGGVEKHFFSGDGGVKSNLKVE